MPFILIDDDLVLNVDDIAEACIEKKEGHQCSGQTKLTFRSNTRHWYLKNLTPVDIYNLIKDAEKTEAQKEIERLEVLFKEKGM